MRQRVGAPAARDNGLMLLLQKAVRPTFEQRRHSQRPTMHQPPMITCRPMLPSPAKRALSVLVFLGTLLVSTVALAQASDMDRLIYNLANSEDFRVRTQAALALGASKSERALPPLCTAL